VGEPDQRAGAEGGQRHGDDAEYDAQRRPP
jgi:hypothetical protein